jgi:uncharacterized protein YkwD
VQIIMKIKISFVLAGLAVLLSAAAAQQRTESPERQIFNAANEARRAQGLMRLKWNEPLARAARQHADVMARQNALSHQFPNEPALPARASHAGLYFISIAENVAQGPDAGNVSDQWVRSPEHRQNLLDPEMNVIGIGIAERDRELFAVEDLARIKPQ